MPINLTITVIQKLEKSVIKFLVTVFTDTRNGLQNHQEMPGEYLFGCHENLKFPKVVALLCDLEALPLNTQYAVRYNNFISSSLN